MDFQKDFLGKALRFLSDTEHSQHIVEYTMTEQVLVFGFSPVILLTAFIVLIVQFKNRK